DGIPSCSRLMWGSSESPGDVRLGARLARTGEDLIGRPRLHQLADVKECGSVRDAGRLLHVMRHDDDRELALELIQQFLDVLRGDRVERGRRLIEQQYLWIVGQRARDAEALLLAARQSERARTQAILHFIPERGPSERALDEIVELPAPSETVDAGTERDVVVDRFRERIPALEHHAHALSQRDDVRVGAVDVSAVEQDLALVLRTRNECVEPVDRPEQLRLAVARRTDERHDRARCDAQRDVRQRALWPVIEREVADLNASGEAERCIEWRRSRLCALRRCRRWARRRYRVAHPNRPVMYASVRTSDGDVKSVSVGATSTRPPARKNAVRSEMRAACCILCVTIMIVTSPRSSRTSCSTLCVLAGS